MGIASDIKKALAELSTACETICRADKCHKCPLEDICFEDYSIVDTINKLDDALIAKMLEMAEDITERQEEAEKTEEQRRWEAEADYWNDRRCDPDDE